MKMDSDPPRRLLIALALALMVPLVLIGCSGPRPAGQPSPKFSGPDLPHGEHSVKKAQERASPPSDRELAPERTASRGALHASLPPTEGISQRRPLEKEVEPGILDFTLVRNREVERYLKYFQNRRRGTFRTWLERYGRYGPMMRRILRKHGLPEDLVFVAMVESGLSPYAYSKARATGPWQFLSSTGKKYGLTINWWIDERRDPVKSTHAAARYLKDLYQMLGSWPLALAGYNAGEFRVKNAMQRVGTADFWRLSRTRYLKRETRRYVPQIMAAGTIAKNPARYGFTDLRYHSPLLYDQVEMEGPTDLRLVARSAGTTYARIKALNPELRRGVTPPHYPGYKVKIPPGATGTFVANFKNMAPSRRTAWQRHRVRRGETISRIARFYGSSVDAIVELNKLDNPHRIRVGDNILIPGTIRKAGGKAVVSASGGSYKTIDGVETFSYTIRPGDTLTDIAREFKVSLEDILRLNNLRDPQYIYAGKNLRLPALEASTRVLVQIAASKAGGKSDRKAGMEFVDHRVRRGQTLSDIALRYRIDMKKIARLNSIKDVNTLRAGQSLKIPIVMPDGAAPPVLGAGATPRGGLLVYKGVKYRQLFHTVRRGDTLWEIARSYDVSLRELKRWNGLIGSQRIYPDDVLQLLIAQN